jgi:hypothetical protein
MTKRVAIIDYGHGNANLIKNALAELDASSVYSSNAAKDKQCRLPDPARRRSPSFCNDVPGGQEAGRVTYRSSDDPQEACFRDLLGHAVDDR